MWPQITLIVLSAISLGVHLVKHGQPKDENYNVVVHLISIAITYSLLYAGDFFDIMMK